VDSTTAESHPFYGVFPSCPNSFETLGLVFCGDGPSARGRSASLSKRGLRSKSVPEGDEVKSGIRCRGVAQPGSAPALGQEPAESWPAFSCDPANSSENSNTSQQGLRHESPHGTAARHQKCHAECHTSCSSGRHSCSGLSRHQASMATGRSNVHILPA